MNNRLRRNIGFVAFGMGLCGLLGCASTKPVKQTQPTSFISGSEGTHLQDDNSSTVQQQPYLIDSVNNIYGMEFFDADSISRVEWLVYNDEHAFFRLITPKEPRQSKLVRFNPLPSGSYTIEAYVVDSNGQGSKITQNFSIP